MKILVKMFLFLSLPMASAADLELQCEAPDPSQLTVRGNQGQIMHNYSFANVTCPSPIRSFLRNSGRMRCHGAWQWDLINGQAVSNTPAWVEITKAGRKITAVSQTNYSYGRKIIRMNCVLNR